MPGLTPGTDTGLWRSPMPEVPGGASVVIPVALAGQAAPGAGGATYSRFIHRAAIADDGPIVFLMLNVTRYRVRL
jgi:hypothetical protein